MKVADVLRQLALVQPDFELGVEVAYDPAAGTLAFGGVVVDAPLLPLSVVETVSSEELNDPDDISFDDWRDEPGCRRIFFPALEDRKDMGAFAGVGISHHYRHSVTFNRDPLSEEEAVEVLSDYYGKRASTATRRPARRPRVRCWRCSRSTASSSTTSRRTAACSSRGTWRPSRSSPGTRPASAPTTASTFGWHTWPRSPTSSRKAPCHRFSKYMPGVAEPEGRGPSAYRGSEVATMTEYGKQVEGKTADGKLTEWLLEVLKVQAKDATIVLPSGEEAMVKLVDNMLIAYQYHEEADQEVWLSVLQFPSV